MQNDRFINTLIGSYGTTYFNSSNILPTGICNIFNAHKDGPRCSSIGLTDSFLLGAVDVVVFVTCTPPPVVRYFDYDLIISARLTEDYPIQPSTRLGDSISSKHISDALPDDIEVFNQPIVILLSMDSLAADKVKSSYIAAGMDNSFIFIREVSSRIIRAWDRTNRKPWQTSNPDILQIISRIVGPMVNDNLLQYNDYKKVIWPARFYMADDNYQSKAPYDYTLSPSLPRQYYDAIIVHNEVVQLSHHFEMLQRNCVHDYVVDRKTFFRTIQYMNLTSYGLYDDWPDSSLSMKMNNNNNTRNSEGTRT